jgi:general secretion pathway protein N
MSRAAWITAAAAVAFLIMLIANFPARWAGRFLPRGTACAQLSGTLWSGSCAGLVAEGTPLGDLSWAAHPLGLLAGKLSLSLSLTVPSGTVSSDVKLGPTGSITAENVRATLPLSRALFAQLPANVQGLVHIDLASLHWDGRRVTALRGSVEVHGLEAQGETLGDYRVSFPQDAHESSGAGDEPTGRVEDLGGPLSVQGSLRLTREPGFVLDTLVAPRANAPPDVVQALRFLGSPDAQGRRPFPLAVTF